MADRISQPYRIRHSGIQITVHEPPEEDDYHSGETDHDYDNDDKLTED